MKISASVVSQMIGDELMILDTSTGTFFSLNQIGASIWREICAGTKIEALYDILIEMSDVDPDQLREDIESLINELCSASILVGHQD